MDLEGTLNPLGDFSAEMSGSNGKELVGFWNLLTQLPLSVPSQLHWALFVCEPEELKG